MPSDYEQICADNVYWVWNPFSDFENCQRRVQWTWRESPGGDFCPGWQPASQKPSKDADSFRPSVEVSDEFMAVLPNGVSPPSIKN